MTIQNKFLIGFVPILLTFAFLCPVTTHAASLVATTTVASTASSTIPSITLSGGVNEVKAVLTIPFTGVPDSSTVFAVGACTIAFTPGGTQNLDCSGGNATINTTVDNTVSAVVARLRTVTGIADNYNHHGALAVGGSGTTMTYTTIGTETTAAGISLEYAGSGTGDITDTSSVVGVVASTTITIPAGISANATDHAIEIDGVTIDLGTSALTANQVAVAIASTSFSGGTVYGTNPYTVTNTSGAILTFTSNATGTSGDGAITMQDDAYGATSQVSTFTPVSPTPDYLYDVTINGNTYAYRDATGITQDIVAGLQSITSVDPSVTCVEQGGAELVCTADTPGVSFTYSASVSPYTVSNVNNDEQGVSGQSIFEHASIPSASIATVSTENSQNEESTESTVPSVMPTLSTQAGSTSVSTTALAIFTRNLSVGAVGADVQMLQMYLNTHGFLVASSGPGSLEHETTTFGMLTRSALAKFQASVGITPAAGYFGLKTRAYFVAHP
jgi:hypothetical protein